MSEPNDYDLVDDAPPAPQPLGYAGPRQEWALDNTGRARTASALLKLYAALSVLNAVLGSVPHFAGTAGELGPDPAGSGVTTTAEGVAGAALIANGVVGCVGFVLFVVTAVYYCMWQYRATFNAKRPRRGDGVRAGAGRGGVVHPAG